MSKITIIVPDQRVIEDGVSYEFAVALDPDKINAVSWDVDAQIGFIERADGSVDDVETDEEFAGVLAQLESVKANTPPSDLHVKDGSGGWVIDLDAYKARHKAKINEACEAAIVSGMVSDALGSPHSYRTDRDDQLNILGVAAAGVDAEFKCADENGVWAFRPHTAAQMRQVYLEGLGIKTTMIKHATTLKAEVDAAQTVEEVEAVVWTDPQ